MKQWIIIYWVFFLCSGVGVAQERFSFTHDWNNNFEWITSIILEDDGYLGTNLTWEFGADTDSIIITKVDLTGNLQQEEVIDMQEGVEIRKAGVLHKLKNEAGYIIGSQAYIRNREAWTTYLTKIDSNLDTVWTKVYLRDSYYTNFPLNIFEKEGGGFICFGSTEYIVDQEVITPLYILHLNAQGEVIEETMFTDQDVSVTGVCPTPDGGYLISGFADSPSSIQPNGNLRSGYLLKIDESGEKEWEKTYNHPYLEGYGQLFWDMKPTQDGNFLIMSTISTAIDSDGWSTDTDALVMKINPVGEVIWEKELGVKGDGHRTYLKSISEAADGTIIVGGNTTTDDGHKGLFYKLSPLGEVIWERYYRHEERTGDHYISKVLATEDGGLVACGSSSSPQDGWLLKLDCNGCLAPDCPLEGETCAPYDCTEDTPPLASFSLPEPPYNTTSEEPFVLTTTNESENAAGYEWLLDGTPIGDSIEPVLSLPGGQSYTLELVATNQTCQDSYTETFFVDNTLHTNENKEIVTPSIYPNPTKTDISIDYSFEPTSQIKLYEVSGKEVFSHTVTAPTDQVNLPLNTINKGVYLLKVTTPQRQFTFKVVKE